MNQLTFFDKIQVLFELLFSSPIIIGIFAFSMVLMIILFFYSRLNKKIIKYAFIGIYVILIGFAIGKYGVYFLTSIDSFVTLFMANIYFPIIPFYIAIMLISFIIMIITLSSKKRSRVVKIINTVFFTLIQMLFALFIYIVESNEIDLSSNTGLYTNEQTLTLLELGMGLFFIWMIILLIVLYLKKADKIFKVRDKNEEQEDFDTYINDFNEPKQVSIKSNSSKSLEVNSGVGVMNPSISNIGSDVNNSSVNTLNVVESKNAVSSIADNNSQIGNINSGSTINGFNMSMSSGLDSYAESIEIDVPSNSTNSSGVYNHNIVDNISTEFKNGFTDPFNSSVNTMNSSLIDNSVSSASVNTMNSNSISSSNVSTNKSSSVNVFDNFDFLNVSNSPVERRNDDVEVLDFD